MKKANLFEEPEHIGPSWELNSLSWSVARDNLRTQTLIDCLLLSHGGLKCFRFDCEDSGAARPRVGVHKLKKGGGRGGKVTSQTAISPGMCVCVCQLCKKRNELPAASEKKVKTPRMQVNKSALHRKCQLEGI